MGDHGTRGDRVVNKNFVNETVNRSFNNIGFFIKDNKFSFKNKNLILSKPLIFFQVSLLDIKIQKIMKN